MFYSGIGSRETPTDFCNLFTSVASYLSTVGYTLRSGGADGADLAFERGSSKSEIYLPWRGFNNNPSNLIVQPGRAFELARQFHPRFDYLSQGGQKLMARNTHQILGLDLETPVDFVICWTPFGSGSGGTGQALRMAKHYNIPVFDAGNYQSVESARVALASFFKSGGRA